MIRVALALWMTVLWVVLWRDASPANVVSGLVVAAVIIAVFPVRRARARDHTVRPLRLLAFFGYFLWQLVVSNVVVAREILTPRDRIRSGIVAVPVPGCSDLVTTVVANAITLTPGTLTLDVWRDPATLYVHVLHLDDLDEARRDIRTMQSMVVRAIGSADAIRALETTPLPAATPAATPLTEPTEELS